MDSSTGTVAAPVAMARVEAATRDLTGSLAGAAVRDLSHDELAALIERGRRGPHRRRRAGRGG